MIDLINHTLSINIQTDNQIIRSAITQIEWAVNQKEFREYILNFKNQYRINCFLQNNNDNEWHLTQFVNGSELNTDIDYTWDSVVSYFDSTTEIIGYTNGLQKTIYLNEKYLNRDLPAICNTLVHEYCHLVGMVHSLFSPGDIIWSQTAPYAIGAYVQYMIEIKTGLPAEKPFFPKVSAYRRVKYRIKKFFGIKV